MLLSYARHYCVGSLPWLRNSATRRFIAQHTAHIFTEKVICTLQEPLRVNLRTNVAYGHHAVVAETVYAHTGTSCRCAKSGMISASTTGSPHCHQRK